jgi:dTMP kinase
MHTRGYFITLEGIEGVGKSTALTFLADVIKKNGMTVTVTREPGGTPLAEAIRQVLLRHDGEELTHEAELLLLFAGRSQHLAHVIQPALARGEWVLCDRFIDATYAYQGGGREMPIDQIRWLDHFVLDAAHRPDVTLLFDAPVEIGLARAHQRGAPDRFEHEKIEFFKRVRQTYLERAAAEPQRFRLIDATQSLDHVQQQLLTIVSALPQRSN